LQTGQPNATATAGLNEAKTQVIEVLIIAPEKAPVVVDGTQVGVAPLPQALFLVPGTHTIAAEDRQQALSEVAGKSVTVDLTLAAPAVSTTVPSIPKSSSVDTSPKRLPVQEWFVKRPGAWVGAGVAVGSLAFSGLA